MLLQNAEAERLKQRALIADNAAVAADLYQASKPTSQRYRLALNRLAMTVMK